MFSNLCGNAGQLSLTITLWVVVTSVFGSKRAQLFEIFEYLPSPISYLFNRMTPIFHLSNHQNQQTWSRLHRQCRLKTLNVV